MNRIQKCVELFLARNFSFKGPLLLALSGGVDSSVLCSIVLEIKKKREFDLEILHIDHSWRKDSREQALFLQKKFEAKKIPFSLFTLDPPQEKNNLEEKARDARLAIFQKIAKERNAEAILLGHHLDDLSETMLKRIFESTPFPFWSAMEEIASFNDLCLWRPLLGISKKEIIAYAKENNIPYLEDSTANEDRFLRNRMRNKLIPELEKSFGKAIGGSLAHLREQSKKMREYLQKRSGYLASFFTECENGYVLNLKGVSPLFEVEIEFFLTELCRKNSFLLSFSQKESIAKLLVKGDEEGVFTTSNLTIKIRGKKAFFEGSGMRFQPAEKENIPIPAYNLR